MNGTMGHPIRDDSEHAESDGAGESQYRHGGEDARRDSGTQGAPMQLVEGVGRDPDGEEERQQRGEEPAQLDVRRQCRLR